MIYDSLWLTSSPLNDQRLKFARSSSGWSDSIGAFKKAGYEVEAKVESSPPAKSKFSYDLVVRKEQY